MRYDISDNKSYELKGGTFWVYLFLLLFLGFTVFSFFFLEKSKFFCPEKFTVWTYVILAVIAFILEFFDASFGVGFGLLFSPALIIFGFHPVDVIMAILLSQFVAGFVAGTSHHLAGNVDFHFGKKHANVAILIILINVIGVLVASLVVVHISQFAVKVYIGFLELLIGIFILMMIDVRIPFSWYKITILGVLSSFNKGMSGAGYGPVLTGGQILSGVETKGAIGITTMTESITCLIGVLFFMLFGESFNWHLTLPLLIGSVIAAPLSAIVVSKVNEKILMKAIGILCLVMGFLVAMKIRASYY